MQPTIIFTSKERMRLYALGSLGFVVTGGAMAVNDDSLRFRVGGVAAIVFFGACLVAFARAALRPAPVLEISSEGLRVNDWRRARRGPLYPWSAIAAVRFYRMKSTPIGQGRAMMDVVPTDASDPMWHGSLRRLNQAYYGTPVSLPTGIVAMEATELGATMQQHNTSLVVESGETVHRYGSWLLGSGLGQ